VDHDHPCSYLRYRLGHFQVRTQLFTVRMHPGSTSLQRDDRGKDEGGYNTFATEIFYG
jgi:hypothetical protein